MNKSSILLASVAGLAVIGVVGATGIMAAESLGTVTGRDGDVLEKVQMDA